MNNRLPWYFVIPGLCTLSIAVIFLLGIQLQNKPDVSDSPSVVIGEITDNPETVPASIYGVEYQLEVANTNASRSLGLSGRTELCDTCGVLFVFNNAAQHGIWMKEMNFDIDILWLDADFAVVHTVHSASPASYPSVFRPESPALYVVELPAGSIPSL